MQVFEEWLAIGAAVGYCYLLYVACSAVVGWLTRQADKRNDRLK